MKIQIGIIAMVVLLTVMEDYVVVYVHACLGEQQHIIEEPNAKDFYATRKGRDHHVEEPIGLIRQIWKLVYLFLPVGIKKEIHNKSHSLNQIG